MQNSAMNTLKSLLGDNAEDKIKSVLGSLSAGDDSNIIKSEDSVDIATTEDNLPASTPNIDTGTLDSLMQIKGIVNNLTNSSNDSRANLLLSLRPYMRSSRQGSIDTAIKLLNLSKLSGIFRL